MSNTDKDNSTSTTINQKEYLKKYLNIGVGSDKKKKKKKSKIIQNRVKIIDDNIDVLNSETLTANELDEFLTQEDAPQVVGVIDDRPLALRLDDYRKNSKWKLVGSDDEQNKIEISEKAKNQYDSFKHTSSDSDRSPPRKTRKDYDSDVSPPRKRNSRKGSVDSDVSPVRKQKRQDDSDASPPRKQKYRQEGSDSDVSPSRKSKNDSDTSLPRKIKLEIKHNSRFGSKLRNVSPVRHKINVTERVRKYDSDSDTSPPRKNKHERNISPRREENQFKRKGTSPMRRKTSNDSPSRGKNHKYRASDSDVSPTRKNKSKDFDNSPKRKDKNNQPRKSRWSDNSPPRHKTNSPPSNKISDYKHKSEEKRYSDYKNKYSSRENKESSKRDKPSDRYSKYFTDDRTESSDKKMEKTLDGKSAGLQNAEELKHETLAFKKREEDLFKKMSEDVSGKNAATIIRDRKTGKKRDFVKEAEEEFAKLKKQQEQKEKYDKWGKGLKQVEDMKEKIESDLHEMSKPLARYADDEDLEKFLKEQEREGDPMLQYIRKKKRKQAATEGRPMKPVYEGEFMPNRFGIPPGHRWDGVDRSNGYEQKWFAKENAKKAVEEEVYKWSTEDM